MIVHADVSASEHALVAAAHAGCIHSFERLVDQFHPRILAYLIHQTEDRELAADVAQQTFLAAFRFLDRLAASSSVSGWLYAVARNKLREEQRRQQIHRFLSLDWLFARGEQALSIGSSDDQAEQCHERDLVPHVLQGLTPVLREALLLYCVGGLPSKDVAHVLGVSDVTARQRISRAKEEFRVRYNSLNGGEDGNVQLAERAISSVC